jgi:hypothetical protein
MPTPPLVGLRGVAYVTIRPRCNSARSNAGTDEDERLPRVSGAHEKAKPKCTLHLASVFGSLRLSESKGTGRRGWRPEPKQASGDPSPTIQKERDTTMSKHTVTRDGTTFLLVPLMTDDGIVNPQACATRAKEIATELQAEATADFDTVAAGINAYLLENPGMKNVSMGTLVRELDVARRLSDAQAGVKRSSEENKAAFERLESVIPNYIRSNTDRFYVGRKMGVQIRFVDGEHVKGDDGEILVGGDGKPKQAYRHTAEEWAKITAPKPEKPEAAKSAPNGAVHAS